MELFPVMPEMNVNFLILNRTPSTLFHFLIAHFIININIINTFHFPIPIFVSFREKQTFHEV